MPVPPCSGSISPSWCALRRPSGDAIVAVFPGAGRSRHFGILDIEQHGLIRLDNGPPTHCSEFLGGASGGAHCNIGVLGGGWYWFSNWWDPGAT